MTGMGSRASHRHEQIGVWPSGIAGVPARISMPTPHPNKYWHSRNYLPHCDTPGLIQSVTFRLHDTLPHAAIERMSADTDNAQKQARVEQLLAAGHGSCWLQREDIATVMENALLHFDGARYRLLAWCIMPNQVHVLIETRAEHPLGDVVQNWKSFTAKKINTLLGRSGSVWLKDYFDRYIRVDHHLAATIDYIEQNPVKAGLVTQAADWPFSSAR